MAAWTHIAHDTIIGGLPAVSVTWSSIPTDGTYDHLLVKVSARTDKAGIFDPVRIQFNGDSTSGNYSNTYTYVGDTSVGGGQDDGENYIHHLYAACCGTTLASTFGTAEIWIPNYANSANYKSVICGGTVNNNSNSGWDWVLTQLGGLWQDQSAITQIDLTTEGASKYQAYSTFDLYGIKGA